MCIGRWQRHNQPSNDPDVGLRHCDLRHGRQCDNARGQMQEFTMGKFHGVALNCLREDFRDAFSLDVRTDGSPGPSNFREGFSTSKPLPRAGGRTKKADESNRDAACQRGISPAIPYRSNTKDIPAFFPEVL